MIIDRKYSEESESVLSELLQDFKQHLRITSCDFDANLLLLLEASLEQAEKETGCIFLPSLITIKGKTIINESGFYPAFEATSLFVDGVERDKSDVQIDGGRIFVQADEGSDIEVAFDAGYLNIPKPVIAAVFLIAAALFNNPVDKIEIMPKASTNLLKSFRRWGN